MRHFTPTLGIKDTSKNVQNFVKENQSVFWDVFKPLIPFIAILTMLDVIVTYVMGVDAETGQYQEFGLGGLISSYLFSCLIISWHRVVIHGPDQFEAMNPWKPQKSEWAFIGMGILIALVPAIFGAIIGITAALIAPVLLVLLVPFVIGAVFVVLKILFYFPSKATGNTITLKQSFSMTTGYVWKMFAANMLAALKTFLLMIAYLIVGGIVIAMIVGAGAVGLGLEAENSSNFGFILGVFYMLPVLFYFQPLLTIIGVTTLSNYYQHALQNKGVPEES